MKSALLCVLFAAEALSLPAAAQVYLAERYFPLAPGTTYTVQGGAATFTCQSGSPTAIGPATVATPVVCSSGDTTYWTNDALGLRKHRVVIPALGATLDFQPPFVSLPQTFGPGSSLQTSGDVLVNGTRVGTYAGTLAVAGEERVTVPAGTFTAVRVQQTVNGTFIDGSSSLDTSTVWLSEDVGGVQESADGMIVQLLSSTRLPLLVSAVLPASRSPTVGNAATVFATIINAGPSVGRACGIALVDALPATLGFAMTDPATNQVVGALNAPVDIPANNGARSFVVALTPSQPIAPTDVRLRFDCENSPEAGILTGINTVAFSASDSPVPDVIALAATISNDGIVNIPGNTGTGAFAVASANVGAGGQITVTLDTGTGTVPAGLTVCETIPADGTCQATPTMSVTTTIPAAGTPTFGVFVQGLGAPVPFSPATNRIYLRFRDATGTVRGATSVAVRTVP